MRGADIKRRIDCLTPNNLTGRQVIEEIYLFAQVSGLRPTDSLRHHYISQPIPSTGELYAAFLCVSTDKETAAQIETANVAYSPNCYRCLWPGHVAKACPHAEALDKFVAQHLDPNNKRAPSKEAPHLMQMRRLHLQMRRPRRPPRPTPPRPRSAPVALWNVWVIC